jgi:hypothetical protein
MVPASTKTANELKQKVLADSDSSAVTDEKTNTEAKMTGRVMGTFINHDPPAFVIA